MGKELPIGCGSCSDLALAMTITSHLLLLLKVETRRDGLCHETCSPALLRRDQACIGYLSIGDHPTSYISELPKSTLLALPT
jgi:hypothetical protein